MTSHTLLPESSWCQVWSIYSFKTYPTCAERLTLIGCWRWAHRFKEVCVCLTAVTHLYKHATLCSCCWCNIILSVDQRKENVMERRFFQTLLKRLANVTKRLASGSLSSVIATGVIDHFLQKKTCKKTFSQSLVTKTLATLNFLSCCKMQ